MRYNSHEYHRLFYRSLAGVDLMKVIEVSEHGSLERIVLAYFNVFAMPRYKLILTDKFLRS